MVRGHAKEVAQQKNAAKQANQAKSTKSGAELQQVRNAGITYTCPVCRQGCPNIGSYKIHFENKHPKAPLPPELATPTA